MTSDPDKYCVWTSSSADDHLTGCGQVIGNVEVSEHGSLEDCPRCDYPILETYEQRDED